MPVADLFAEVKDAIPLHHATRAGNVRTYQNSPVHMRFQALRNYLIALNVSIEPPVRSGMGNALKMAATVTAHSKSCPCCGKAFFSYKSTMFCSPRCRNMARMVPKQTAAA